MTKLNATGSAPLRYSTYLGGSSADAGHGIAVAAPDSVYVTVKPPNNLPTTAGPQ